MHDKVKSRSRRAIPAVTKILDSLGEKASPARTELPRPLIVDLVRQELALIRRQAEIPEFSVIIDRVCASLEKLRASRIQPVINGTGIVIHTNLGRSPLPQGAAEVLRNVAASYNNLELDLATGNRGGRGAYLERALAVLCQAEAATVVNNCAAALVLIVRHFTADRRAAGHAEAGRRRVGAKKTDTTERVPPKEIVISRGELIQIGGGFRIGEILEASGATLREVGSTNKTTLSDYSRAIGKETALILKVHRSNFFMSGFVESVSTAELAGLARKKRIPLVEDLGSGALVPTEQIGLHHHEPTPGETLKNGADLVAFSGDKLFGGPQAGIIAGRKRLVDSLKKEPLFRALRCDKLVFAALQTTVDLHLNQVTSEIPPLALLQMPKDELRARAAAIVTRLRGLPLQITIGSATAKAGGGALPKSIMPSITIDVLPENCSVEDFARALRRSVPPIIGYIGDRRLKLDLRTIFPHQDDLVVDAIRAAGTTSHHEAH
jgi:L-seryl-tRNA(Ser) seleniumtransferase